MSKVSLNLKDSKYSLKTVYAGRRSETPLLSINKGSILLNSAFHKTFYPDRQNRHLKVLYFQLVEKGGCQFFLISTQKLPCFYTALRNNKDVKGYGFMNICSDLTAKLGKKGSSMRYELVETSHVSIKGVDAYKLKEAAEDKFYTFEKPDFETYK